MQSLHFVFDPVEGEQQWHRIPWLSKTPMALDGWFEMRQVMAIG
jgi:hypothetical protein